MYCQATSFLHPVFFSAKVVYFFYFDYFFAVFLPFFLCFTLLHILSDAQMKGKRKIGKNNSGKVGTLRLKIEVWLRNLSDPLSEIREPPFLNRPVHDSGHSNLRLQTPRGCTCRALEVTRAGSSR